MSSCNDPCADNISIIVDTGSAGPIGPPGPAAKVLEWTYYLNPGDTIVSGDDASAKPLAYTPDSVQVYLNGVQLSKRDDYTTDADGNSIVLNEAIVNANDILVVISQVPPEEGYDPTNDFDRLDGKIQDNTDAITGLDVRVTANEEAIEGLTGLAGGFTTRDVKVSGVSPQRGRGEDLQTQQDINYLFDGEILENTARLEALEGGQPDLTSDIADLRTDVDENTQGISDNAQALNDLVDVVEANSNGIDGLQTQIDKLPPPTDISDLEKDVDDIAKSVAGNTVAISKNTADIAALDEPVDLDPLNAAIATNAAGISQNAKDITSLKATDAKHTGEISDLQTSVGHLEAIDIPDNYAVVDEDNSFETSQTIKGGISITGTDAFVKADTGSAVTFSNNNAYNPVIEIERSNGDVSLALHADGHIRGVKTDENDDSSAVSVGWFQDNVGAGGDDTDLSKYATKIELKTEEFARIQGDDLLAKELEDAISTQKYDDTKLTNRIAQEEAARASSDSNLDKKIKTEAQYREEGDDALQAQLDALQIPAVDPVLYATVVAMEKGDADTLAAANTFTTEAIAGIEFPEGVDLDGLASEEWVTEQIADFATENFVEEAIGAIEFPAGTVVGETPPADAEEGATWYDTARLELFVFASNAWLPCSPLGARVEQGEAVQAQILSQINVSLEEQEALRNKIGELDSKKMGLSGNHNIIDTTWRVKSGPNLVMSGSTEGSLKIYNLAEPTFGHHAATMTYVDNSIEAGIAGGNFAKKDGSNTWTGIQTMSKTTYFQNAVVHNGKSSDTIAEIRGDHEDETKQLWWKIRGTNRVSWICYPGQENVGYKKCMEMEWDAEADRPLVKLDYLQTPTGGSQAATKKYVDEEVAKAGGGSFAKSGATTPELSAGELFFNTTDKILYIGE